MTITETGDSPRIRDGKKRHPLYEAWRAMVRRCHDPRATGYHNYGARGITVCQRWRSSFWVFIADVGEKPSPLYSLDRIDNSQGYEPGNVRWATQAEQHRNARFNHLMTARDKTQTLSDWSVETGIPKTTLFNRLRRGWSDEDVITTPVQQKAPNYTLFPPGGAAIVAERGLNLQTVKSRLIRGWTFEDAITKPIKAEHKKKEKRR